MDLGSNGIKIKWMRGDNFNSWKHRIQHVLSMKELRKFITIDDPDHEDYTLKSWGLSDKKAIAIIGLTLSNNHLEQIRHVNSTKEMWTSICDIYKNILS